MAYDAVTDVQISDHKPVYALFKVHTVSLKETERSMSLKETERSMSFGHHDNGNGMEPRIRMEAPLDLQRYFLQIEFLQKNYNFHFAESLKALPSQKLNGNDMGRQKAFNNFEASHNDLV